MQRLLQISVLFSLLPAIFSCSVVDEAILSEEIGEFSQGIVSLSAIITEEFAIAEEINTIGYTDNLKFQLELGGSPDTTLKPLLSASDLAARQSLLSALDGYAETLAAVVSGKQFSSEYLELAGRSENLKQLNAGSFNLLHSLSFLDSSELVNQISLFDQIFILPERDKKLLPIMEKGKAALKKMAILLYFDIGSVSDQSDKCSYTYPKNNLDTDMTNLRLCKGGLRSIVANAVAFDTNIWKDKLSYIAAKGIESADRDSAIERLVAIQKLGQSMDKLLRETQSTLIAMVKAHEVIEMTLKDAEKSNVPSIGATTKALLFRARLSGLLDAAAIVKSKLASLSDGGKSPQKLQRLNLTTIAGGANDGK